jgi:hypothetical protein
VRSFERERPARTFPAHPPRERVAMGRSTARVADQRSSPSLARMLPRRWRWSRRCDSLTDGLTLIPLGHGLDHDHGGPTFGPLMTDAERAGLF